MKDLSLREEILLDKLNSDLLIYKAKIKNENQFATNEEIRIMNEYKRQIEEILKEK